MVSQLGLSPTSTLLDVKSALQQAIAQEEATLRGAQERLTCYQQQLASLASLVSLSPEVTTLESTPIATNGTGATITAETNGASTLSPAETKPAPQRTGGQKPKRAASTAAKNTGSRSKAVTKIEPAVAATPVTAALPTAEAVPTAAEEPAELPKLLKAFRGKSLSEAVQTALSTSDTPLSAKAITEKLYGKKLLEDNDLLQRLTRLVSKSLIQGVEESVLQKEGRRPVLYRTTSVPAAV